MATQHIIKQVYIAFNRTVISKAVIALILILQTSCSSSTPNNSIQIYNIFIYIITITLVVININIAKKLIRKKKLFQKEVNEKITLKRRVANLVKEIDQKTEKNRRIIEKYSMQNEEHKVLIDEIRSNQMEMIKVYEQLKSSEEKYRILAETSQDIILLVSKTGELKYANNAANAIVELSEDKASNLFDFITEKHKNIVRKYMQERQSGDFTKRIYEIEIIDKDNRTIPVEISSNPIVKDNKFFSVLLVIRNIQTRINTELELLKKNKELIKSNKTLSVLNEELDKSRKKAIESDKLKTAFLANMSHEIRTPMNGIIGFVSLLGRSDITPEKQQQYISIIQNSTDQLLRIISDIIDFSKIEANELQLSISKLDTDDFFNDVRKDADDIIAKKQKKSLKFNCDYNSITEYEIYCDKLRLKQIFLNLIDNSVKFTESGEIVVKAFEKDKRYIVFSVTDTGIGISEQNSKIIFERFRQLENTFHRKYGGTGLGLSICKGLVNLMGGEIWIESEEDKGTSVFFTLPIENNTKVS
ncbi:MAG: ATP-binding protein [Bacteroidales bacterium]|jgi:PAS domain S-box-containing protein|nr:ATP-binding protein [Bacteroidales bacterium]